VSSSTDQLAELLKPGRILRRNHDGHVFAVVRQFGPCERCTVDTVGVEAEGVCELSFQIGLTIELKAHSQENCDRYRAIHMPDAESE
jgi:hypothetical protein